MFTDKSVPLFGVNYDLSFSEKEKVVYLGDENHEKELTWFWFLFEWTIAQLIANRVEKKSLEIVRQYIFQQEMNLTKNGECSNGTDEECKLMLPKARRVFGDKKISELFDLKTMFFNENSELLQHFCRTVATADALDDVYNAVGSFAINGDVVWPESADPDFWSNLYLSVPNAQSVRNRYRMVARIYYQLGGGKTLSIACGSAQPLIHAVHELVKVKAKGYENITCTLTDVSQDPLDLARKKAAQAGVEDNFEFKLMPFQKMVQALQNESYDFIEACGILDYLPEKHFKMLVGASLDSLDEEGHLIISNMAPTRGADLLRRMYNWEIIYRTPKEFATLIEASGGKEVKVFVDPWKIHTVAIVKK